LIDTVVLIIELRLHRTRSSGR